ncbi:hypothetical protein AMECASPLE_029198 [Ameca splendens]|uniref:Uncharacterized protein n=1 Tax=Ameca splendens TaxID=208324 RepID=A0ABV0YT58_9TELE
MALILCVSGEETAGFYRKHADKGFQMFAYLASVSLNITENCKISLWYILPFTVSRHVNGAEILRPSRQVAPWLKPTCFGPVFSLANEDCKHTQLKKIKGTLK